MSLTAEQVKLIQDTWALVYKDKVQNGVDFFLVFFAAYPEYQDHFEQLRGLSQEELKNDPKMKAHATTVMHALQSFVETLTDLDILVELVKKNAVRHVPRGLGKDEFHNLFVLFAKFLQDKLGARWTEPVATAWTTVVTVMSDVTDAAMDEAMNEGSSSCRGTWLLASAGIVVVAAALVYRFRPSSS